MALKAGAPSAQEKMIGQKFGRLIVVGLSERSKNHVKCECECGNTTHPLGRSVRQGQSKSCGCLNRQKMSERRWKGHGELSGSYWARVCLQAEVRGIYLDITIEFAWELFLKQDKRCALTGMVLVMNGRTGSASLTNEENTVSLDRIDNDKGYTEDNVWWVHKDTNEMKMDRKLSYFVELCRAVANHFPVESAIVA